MRLEKLDISHPDIPLLKKLNNEAFPDSERVDIEELFRFAEDGGNSGQTDILGIYHEDSFAGFFVIITDPYIAYIAYFAVCSEKRSQGIGGNALRALSDHYSGRQVVVDFESVIEPNDDPLQRKRRRDFYLRSGFIPTGWYMFYMEHEFEITCSSAEFDKEHFEQMLAGIHARAPMFDPHLYRHDS